MENFEDNNERIIQNALEKLEKLADYLESIGLTPIRENITRSTLLEETTLNGAAIPLVRDGSMGIRYVFQMGKYDKGIRLAFTNGFEDPDDEVVKKVKVLWKEI